MKEFRFAQADNGGWVVFSVVSAPDLPQIVAAFSSTTDLIAGFVDLLSPPEGETGDVELGEGDI